MLVLLEMSWLIRQGLRRRGLEPRQPSLQEQLERHKTESATSGSASGDDSGGGGGGDGAGGGAGAVDSVVGAGGGLSHGNGSATVNDSSIPDAAAVAVVASMLGKRGPDRRGWRAYVRDR